MAKSSWKSDVSRITRKTRWLAACDALGWFEIGQHGDRLRTELDRAYERARRRGDVDVFDYHDCFRAIVEAKESARELHAMKLQRDLEEMNLTYPQPADGTEGYRNEVALINRMKGGPRGQTND
jgi:hypothetical protein